MLVLTDTDTKYLFFLSYSGNIPQPVFLEQGDSQVHCRANTNSTKWFMCRAIGVYSTPVRVQILNTDIGAFLLFSNGSIGLGCLIVGGCSPAVCWSKTPCKWPLGGIRRCHETTLVKKCSFNQTNLPPVEAPRRHGSALVSTFPRTLPPRKRPQLNCACKRHKPG